MGKVASDFAKILKQNFDTAKEKAVFFVKKIALGGFTDVSINTPVDTGRARANWNISRVSPDISQGHGTMGDTEREATNNANKVIREKSNNFDRLEIRLGDDIYFSNNVPYIAPLNDGSPDREGDHFVELALQNMEKEAANVVDLL